MIETERNQPKNKRNSCFRRTVLAKSVYINHKLAYIMIYIFGYVFCVIRHELKAKCYNTIFLFSVKFDRIRHSVVHRACSILQDSLHNKLGPWKKMRPISIWLIFSEGSKPIYLHFEFRIGAMLDRFGQRRAEAMARKVIKLIDAITLAQALYFRNFYYRRAKGGYLKLRMRKVF